jgi:hypothetical protein
MLTYADAPQVLCRANRQSVHQVRVGGLPCFLQLVALTRSVRMLTYAMLTYADVC